MIMINDLKKCREVGSAFLSQGTMPPRLSNANSLKKIPIPTALTTLQALIMYLEKKNHADK